MVKGQSGRSARPVLKQECSLAGAAFTAGLHRGTWHDMHCYVSAAIGRYDTTRASPHLLKALVYVRGLGKRCKWHNGRGERVFGKGLHGATAASASPKTISAVRHQTCFSLLARIAVHQEWVRGPVLPASP